MVKEGCRGGTCSGFLTQDYSNAEGGWADAGQAQRAAHKAGHGCCHPVWPHSLHCTNNLVMMFIPKTMLPVLASWSGQLVWPHNLHCTSCLSCCKFGATLVALCLLQCQQEQQPAQHVMFKNQATDTLHENSLACRSILIGQMLCRGLSPE